MSEKNAYQSLRDGIRQPGDRIQRIENVRLEGMPDVNMCLWGAEFWIEIKSPNEPKKLTSKLFGSSHKLSQDQKNWFLIQRNAGGSAFIYIETNLRRLLIHGLLADYVNEMSVEEAINRSLWNSIRPTSKDRWMELRLILRRETLNFQLSKQNLITTK
jgi:hypothetical protein